MYTKLLDESDGRRTFAVILETGDELMECIERLAAHECLTAAQLSAIGALSDADLSYYDWDTKTYLRKSMNKSRLLHSMATSSLARTASRPFISMQCWAGGMAALSRAIYREHTCDRHSKAS